MKVCASTYTLLEKLSTCEDPSVSSIATQNIMIMQLNRVQIQATTHPAHGQIEAYVKDTSNDMRGTIFGEFEMDLSLNT